jgi:hypothetical protein
MDPHFGEFRDNSGLAYLLMQFPFETLDVLINFWDTFHSSLDGSPLKCNVICKKLCFLVCKMLKTLVC